MIDIDDLVKEFRKDPELAEALDEADIWVSETFHPSCLFNSIKEGLVTGIACSCPKCAVTC